MKSLSFNLATDDKTPSLLFIIPYYQISLGYLSWTSQLLQIYLHLPVSLPTLCGYYLLAVRITSLGQRSTGSGASIIPYDLRGISAPVAIHALVLILL